MWLHFIVTQILIYTIMESKFLLCPRLTLLRRNNMLWYTRTSHIPVFFSVLRALAVCHLAPSVQLVPGFGLSGQQINAKSSTQYHFKWCPFRVFLPQVVKLHRRASNFWEPRSLPWQHLAPAGGPAPVRLRATAVRHAFSVWVAPPGPRAPPSWISAVYPNA